MAARAAVRFLNFITLFGRTDYRRGSTVLRSMFFLCCCSAASVSLNTVRPASKFSFTFSAKCGVEVFLTRSLPFDCPSRFYGYETFAI